MKYFTISSFLLTLFVSCIDSNNKNVNTIENIDNTNAKKTNGVLFKEDSLSIEVQKNRTFKPMLSKKQRSDSNKLLSKLLEFYKIPAEDGLETNKLYSTKMYGCSDSIWVMECFVPKDSLCKPHGRKQQFFFDSKGHLIHSDKAATLNWIIFKDNSAPMLMMLNTDCNGTGFHHFYKFEQGEFIDIYNVLLDNTPITFDSNKTDGSELKPAELELKMEDKNGDKIKDISFKGTRQEYKNGVITKIEQIEYLFIYETGEDWFLLKSTIK